MDRPPPRFNRQVQRELETIFDYIKEDSPDNAANLIAEILDAVERLGEFPVVHKVVGRSRKHGVPVHSFTVRKYVVYYWIHQLDGQVNLITIRHGARRQPKRFG